MVKIIWILLCALAQQTHQLSFCSTCCCTISFNSSSSQISKKNNQILEVKLENSVLETFPNQLFGAYPELRKCNISESMLKDLDIKSETKLEWLDASRNQISELSAVTMKNIHGIVSLYLSRNNITDLKPYLFDDLKQLEILDLSHNQITFLDGDIFAALTSLRFLYFNHNYLTTVYLNLSKADNLTNIDGGHNQIEDVEIFLQSGFKRLLNLEFNQIVDSINIADVDELTLDRNRIRSLILKETSTKVSVNSNQIQSIEISPRAELEVLLIRNNLLTDIRNITEIVSIQVLDISYNPIQSIEEHSFDKMTNLIDLSLRNTGLLIPKIFLPAQRKLTYLDISGNKISRLDFRSLKYLINLQTLKIENCSMERIENFKNQKEILPSLRSISFDGNKLPCSFTVKFLNQCLKNEIEFLSDPIPTDKKSLNILGISCIGIEELEDDERWQDQLTVASEFNKSLLNSSIGQRYMNKNKTQSSVLDQPKMTPELNEEIGKSSMVFLIEFSLILLNFALVAIIIVLFPLTFGKHSRNKIHDKYKSCERSS